MAIRSALLASVILSALDSTCNAQMTFYYAPSTGNVSFDTTGVPNDEINGYGLQLNRNRADEIPDGIRFRYENLLRVFPAASHRTSNPFDVSEASTSQTLSGYFTMGDVLPPELSEETWRTLFSEVNLPLYSDSVFGTHVYLSSYLDTRNTPPATLVYGQPDRPFDNRWDLVDPDALDWATSARLVYDPTTGEVVIDTLGQGGGHITYWAIESDGAFLADNFTPWIDVPFTTANADVIGLAADAIEPGEYNLGAILPAELTLDEVQAAFTSARFMGRAGFGGASFDLAAEGTDFGFAMAVPEPTATLLAAIALTAAGIGRRLG